MCASGFTSDILSSSQKATSYRAGLVVAAIDPFKYILQYLVAMVTTFSGGSIYTCTCSWIGICTMVTLTVNYDKLL